MALLYTRCTDIYNSLTDIGLWVPQTLYKHYEFRSRPFKQVHVCENVQGSATPLKQALTWNWYCCIPAVRICTAPWLTSPYGYHRLCTQIMSFRSAHKAEYTNYHIQLRPIQQVYDIANAHGSTIPQSEHLHANSIVVHPLYRSVQLPDLHRLTGTTDCVYKLRVSIAFLIAGVQFRKLVWQYTIPRDQSDLCTRCTDNTAPGCTSPCGYHKLCTPAMRTHGAPHSERAITKLSWHYTIPRITLMQKAFLYTCCTELYSYLTYIAFRVTQALCTCYEDPWCPM